MLVPCFYSVHKVHETNLEKGWWLSDEADPGCWWVLGADWMDPDFIECFDSIENWENKMESDGCLRT